MRQMLETLFNITIHPEFDGERETFAVLRDGQWLTFPSLAALWAGLLAEVPAPVFEWRAAA